MICDLTMPLKVDTSETICSGEVDVCLCVLKILCSLGNLIFQNVYLCILLYPKKKSTDCYEIVALNFILSSRLFECLYACMYACMNVCMHACIHSCIHVCIHAFMYVCMCVF